MESLMLSAGALARVCLLLTILCLSTPNMQSKGSLWHFKGAVSCSPPISKLTELKGCALAVNLAHSFQFLPTEMKKMCNTRNKSFNL